MATKAKAKPRLTHAERQEVVEEAIRLIKEPAHWTTGSWKCPVFEVDDKGHFIEDEKTGEWKQATDHFNRPLSQYCIEGAVNQATVNVVGEDRASRLGAYSKSDAKGEDGGLSGPRSNAMTDRLGIDAIAKELYSDLIEETGDGEDEMHPALVVNDYFESDDPEGHKTVIDLLQRALKGIKSKRKGGV